MLWVYLSASPLLWLTLTVGIWVAVSRINNHFGNHALANPVLISILILAVILTVARQPYETYFAGAQFIHFMLGPATVALALPLVRYRHTVLRKIIPITVSLVAGSIVAVLSTVSLAKLAHLEPWLVLSLAPRSTTTPVAMAIAETYRGDAALTAVIVICTGITGAVFGPRLLRRIATGQAAAQGFAMGLAAHGIGTTRAFKIHETAGVFASLAMVGNAMLTGIIVAVVLGSPSPA